VKNAQDRDVACRNMFFNMSSGKHVDVNSNEVYFLNYEDASKNEYIFSAVPLNSKTFDKHFRRTPLIIVCFV
jgi:hypothetical protein